VGFVDATLEENMLAGSACRESASGTRSVIVLRPSAGLREPGARSPRGHSWPTRGRPP
jgi:hypothetical protein